MKYASIVFSLIFSISIVSCSGNTQNANEKIIDVAKNGQKLDMSALFDIPEGEATQMFKSISYPAELKGRMNIKRERNREMRLANLMPCTEVFRSKSLEAEFNNIPQDNQRNWLVNAQNTGKLGWNIGVKLSHNISVTEVISGDGGEDYLVGFYLLQDELSGMEIAENECASFIVDQIEMPFEQEFVEGQIGQVLVVGIKKESE